MIIVILLVISIIAAANNMLNGPNMGIQAIVHDLFTIITGPIILHYNFFGYKQPHGNLMRYVFFLFGTSLIIRAIFSTELSISLIANAIAGIIVVYMSGRLNKIKKNKTLAIITLLLILASTIMMVFKIDIALETTEMIIGNMEEPTTISKLFLSLGSLGVLFQWIAITLAYSSRYKEHKEAGLLDKPTIKKCITDTFF